MKEKFIIYLNISIFILLVTGFLFYNGCSKDIVTPTTAVTTQTISSGEGAATSVALVGLTLSVTVDKVYESSATLTISGGTTQKVFFINNAVSGTSKVSLTTSKGVETPIPCYAANITLLSTDVALKTVSLLFKKSDAVNSVNGSGSSYYFYSGSGSGSGTETYYNCSAHASGSGTGTGSGS